MKRVIMLLISVLYISGCSTHITDFSMISSKNVIGEDKKFVFLFIPFGQPTIKGALNDALQKGNGDLMVDASVYVTNWWFLIGQTGIEIKGDVVKTREGE